VKLLGNPWVVGGLCVIAAGVVGYQFLPSHRPGAMAPSSGAPQPAPAALGANGVPGTPPGRSSDSGQAAAHLKPGTNLASRATSIDRHNLQSRMPDWLASPRRDPFLLTVPRIAAPGAVSPVRHWRLKSVWHQTGSRLATINDRLYAEGDEIEGYKLETIEPDRVWFQGPTGRESLSFTNVPAPPLVPTATHAPAAK
jgi:hypothetical protein